MSQRPPRSAASSGGCRRSAHRLIPLMRRRADAGRVPGAGLGRGHRLPPRAGRRLHRRRRRRHVLGAVRRARASPPTAARTWLLPAPVGVARARELLLLGRALTGAEAAEWGLVHRAVPAGRARRRGRRARRRSSPPGPPSRSGSPSGCCTPAAAPTLDAQLAERGASPSSCRRAARTSARAWRPSARSATRVHRADDDDDRDRPRRPASPSTRAPAPTRPAPAARRGSTSTCPRRGGTPRRAAARRPSARCAPAPTTRPGTRCSARSGLVVPTWPVEYGGLDVEPGGRPGHRGRAARRTTSAGSTRSGSTWPRRRCSPTAPRSSACASCRRSCATRRCGASCSASRAPGRDLASLAMPGRARRRRVGRHRPEGVDHVGAPRPTSACCWPAPIPTCTKRKGITYFLVDLHQPGVDVRPLRHITGEIDFNEVFLDGGPGARRPAGRRGRRRLAGRQRHAVGRAPDGVGLGLGRRRPHRRLGHRPRSSARPASSGALGRPGRAPGAHARCTARSASAAGPTSGCGPGSRPAGRRDPRARSARCTRARSTSASSCWPPTCSGRRRMAWESDAGELRRVAALRGARACSAAGPTRSRAAPPR